MDNSSKALKSAREKIRQVVVEIATAAYKSGAKSAVKTVADVFGLCLKKKVFTDDENAALRKFFPSESNGKLPSVLAARDVLESLRREGVVRDVKLSYGSFPVPGYELIGAANEGNDE